MGVQADARVSRGPFLRWAAQPGFGRWSRRSGCALGPCSAPCLRCLWPGAPMPACMLGGRWSASRFRECARADGAAALPERRAAARCRRGRQPSRLPTASTRGGTPARGRTATGVLARAGPSPFERDRALWWPHPLDEAALERAPGCFQAGTTSRRSRRPAPSTCASSATCCGPSGASADGLLEFWIEADAFMRHMVRVLVGTMLEVGAGRRDAAELRRAARGGARHGAQARRPGPTACAWRASVRRCAQQPAVGRRRRSGADRALDVVLRWYTRMELPVAMSAMRSW